MLHCCLTSSFHQRLRCNIILSKQCVCVGAFFSCLSGFLESQAALWGLKQRVTGMCVWAVQDFPHTALAEGVCVSLSANVSNHHMP